MELIPSLFKFESGYVRGAGRVKTATSKITPGFECVLRGEAIATEMIDGESCAIIDGVFYRKANTGYWKAELPEGSIPIRTKWNESVKFYWIPISPGVKKDLKFLDALENTPWISPAQDCLYEAVGKDFKTNPYGLDANYLEVAGRIKIKDLTLSYTGIYEWLKEHEGVEGIVWWKDGSPMCKIRRKDFGLVYPPIIEGVG